MPKPTLTFFCELENRSLVDLINDHQIINDLKTLDANLSLGLIDLSEQRAQVVKKLNRAGIPVTAWILLPKEYGYWTNLDSIEETVAKYIAFKIWKEKYNLDFAAIGLDIEPKLDFVSSFKRNPLIHIPNLIKRLFESQHYRNAEMSMRALIHSIHIDGYAVEAYQFPTVVDERKSRSNTLAKTLGLPALPVDREVLMLYSSFFPKFPDSILWSYVQASRAVGLGSTGGGVEIEGFPPLRTMRWIDLKRDLLLASQHAEHLYIFSLEGCVTNQYMDRLIDLDWSTQVIPPVRSAMGISLIRKVGQTFLWALSHPLEIMLGLIVGKKVFTYFERLGKRIK